MSVVSSISKLFARRENAARVLSVWNETRGSQLANAAGVADCDTARRRGLLKHDSLAPGQGLWIVPCEGVHSCGMKFVFDVVYLDSKKRVRKIRAGMAPWRFSMCLTAHSVLELPAGSIAATRTQAGDQLQFSFVNAG